MLAEFLNVTAKFMQKKFPLVFSDLTIFKLFSQKTTSVQSSSMLTSLYSAIKTFNKPLWLPKKFNPTINPEIQSLIDERENRRTRDPADPTIPALNSEIDSLTRETVRSKWRNKRLLHLLPVQPQ